MAKKTLLQVEDLSLSYERVAALKQVSIEVDEGEIVALIGANGAGKSTLLRAVLGLIHGSSGRIFFMGQNITRKSTNSIVASGISYVPEGGGVLPLMTIRENLLLGSLYNKADFNRSLQQVYGRFPFLQERHGQLAGTLSGGQRQMLAIGRALMGSPKLMMLDEPSLGLAPLIITEVLNIVAELRRAGYSILLSEQNARKALQYADRVYVFEVGKIIYEGKAKDLENKPEVQRAYLGGV